MTHTFHDAPFHVAAIGGLTLSWLHALPDILSVIVPLLAGTYYVMLGISWIVNKGWKRK